jgi:hypothetical protein
VAEALRLPSYRWYTPLWHGVRSLLEGRYSDAAQAREQARALGTAAGDGNAELFARMLEHGEHVLLGDYAGADWTFMEDALHNSPAAMAYRPSYAWMLAGVGRTDEARSELDALAVDGFAAIPFDANWISAMAELSEACLILEDRARAAVVHELMKQYAGMTTPAGRAVTQYGFVDEFLGRLGLLLGRPEARAQIEGALARYERHGWRPFAERARATLARTSRVVG